MWLSKAHYLQIITRDAINAERDTMILELRRQITDLKDQLQLALARQDREQQRADNALSALTRVKTGVDPESPPVTPSLPEIDPHAEDPAEVEALRQEILEHGSIQTLLSYK